MARASPRSETNEPERWQVSGDRVSKTLVLPRAIYSASGANGAPGHQFRMGARVEPRGHLGHAQRLTLVLACLLWGVIPIP